MHKCVLLTLCDSKRTLIFLPSCSLGPELSSEYVVIHRLYLHRYSPRGGLSRHHQLRWLCCGHFHRWCFVGSYHTEVPSPGVAALKCFAAQAKLSLPGLRAPERPLFTYTPSLSVWIQVTQWIGVWSAEVCWLHRHLQVNKCSIYHPALAYRPFDTHWWIGR